MTERELDQGTDLESENDGDPDRGWLAEQVRLLDLEDGFAA